MCDMDDELPLSSLGPVDDVTKQRLGQLLWGWSLCGDCNTTASCLRKDCPWSRAESFGAFWDLYERMTDAYYPERLSRKAALSSHDELLDIVRTIKDHHTLTRVSNVRALD